MNTGEIEEQRLSKIRKAKEMVKILEIPSYGGVCWKSDTIYAIDLYDILMDEEKLRVLVFKLRNKAFWQERCGNIVKYYQYSSIYGRAYSVLRET